MYLLQITSSFLEEFVYDIDQKKIKDTGCRSTHEGLNFETDWL